jgi:hypothetical protein
MKTADYIGGWHYRSNACGGVNNTRCKLSIFISVCGMDSCSRDLLSSDRVPFLAKQKKFFNVKLILVPRNNCVVGSSPTVIKAHRRLLCCLVE